MEFVRFMPKAYQAAPEVFAGQTPERQVAVLLKGVRLAGRGLDEEASGLAAKTAAGTASAAEKERLTAIRENSFYLSGTVRLAVEKSLAADSTLEKAKRISLENPARQGDGYDGVRRRSGTEERAPVAADDSPGGRKKGLALKPYQVKINDQVVRTPGGAEFSLRSGADRDVSKVTELIHDAFSIWKEAGLSLGPMYQTDEQTAAHLVGKGYVAENSRGELAGTFSLDEGTVRELGTTKVRLDAEGSVTDYARIGEPKTVVPKGRLLVFKKAAVKRDTANAGLGSELYALAEKNARDNGYAGMVLETVKEAGWLYDWYVRLGFKPIGVYRFPGRQVDTILMVKVFE